jgi:hypothetical protein
MSGHTYSLTQLYPQKATIQRHLMLYFNQELSLHQFYRPILKKAHA